MAGCGLLHDSACVPRSRERSRCGVVLREVEEDGTSFLLVFRDPSSEGRFWSLVPEREMESERARSLRVCPGPYSPNRDRLVVRDVYGPTD